MVYPVTGGIMNIKLRKKEGRSRRVTIGNNACGIVKMKRKPDSKEYELIRNELSELGLNSVLAKLSPDNLMINGITFFQASDSPDGKIITYSEDDLKDENGNSYIFDYPYYKYFGELEPGRRLIALYYGFNYLVLPVTDETFTLVGAVNTEEKLDRANSPFTEIGSPRKLPTPMVLDLPKDPARPVVPSDTERIKEAVKSFGKFTAAKTVGMIAMIFLCIIVVGLAYIFTLSAFEDLTPGIFAACTVIAVTVLITGIVCSVKFFKNIYLRNVLKMKYIKKVMIVGVSNELLQPNFKTLAIYEWIDNKIVFSRHTMGFGQLFLDKDVSYGDQVYMLTKEKDERAKVVNTRIFMSER